MNQIITDGIKRHPIFKAFTSDVFGNIINTNNGKFKRKYCMMGTYYVCIRDGILYKYNNFVWECYNGLLNEDTTVENIDGNKKNNQLKNLQLVPLKVDEYQEIEIGMQYEMKNHLQAIERLISKIHIHLDSKY